MTLEINLKGKFTSENIAFGKRMTSQNKLLVNFEVYHP